MANQDCIFRSRPPNFLQILLKLAPELYLGNSVALNIFIIYTNSGIGIVSFASLAT